MEYKEMKYQATRLSPPDALASGEYQGYNFFVLNQGTHPCAYVEIPKTSKFFGKGYDEINVFCNGGLTYAREHLSTVDYEGWFIGWDYAHCWDYCGYNSAYGLEEGEKHYTVEMISDCESVIDQLIALEAES